MGSKQLKLKSKAGSDTLKFDEFIKNKMDEVSVCLHVSKSGASCLACLPDNSMFVAQPGILAVATASRLVVHGLANRGTRRNSMAAAAAFRLALCSKWCVP